MFRIVAIAFACPYCTGHSSSQAGGCQQHQHQLQRCLSACTEQAPRTAPWIPGQAARHAKRPPVGAPPPGSPIEAWADMPVGRAAQRAASQKNPPARGKHRGNAAQVAAICAKPPPLGAPPPRPPSEARTNIPLDIAAQVAARHAKLPPFGAPPPGSLIEAWAGMPLGRAAQRATNPKHPHSKHRGNAAQEAASTKLPPVGKLPSPPLAALKEASTSPGGPPAVAAAKNSPASGPELTQTSDNETIAAHQTTVAFSALRIGPGPADPQPASGATERSRFG